MALYALVGKTGFEPATLWSQTRCATKLRYFPKMARPTGIEPVTPRFVVWYSIQLSYGRIVLIKYNNIRHKLQAFFRDWRFLTELNRRSLSCSQLPYHLAKEPRRWRRFLSIASPTLCFNQKERLLLGAFGFAPLMAFALLLL